MKKKELSIKKKTEAEEQRRKRKEEKAEIKRQKDEEKEKKVNIQGDQAACPKPPVDNDLKLRFSIRSLYQNATFTSM